MMHQHVLDYLSNKVFNKDIEKLERLYGGMSNYNYLVTIDNKKYIFRIPLESSNIIINRKYENLNLEKLINKDYLLKTVYFDDHFGYKISEYVDGTSLKYVDEDKIPYDLVTNILKDLHNNVKFDNTNNPFDELLDLEKLAENNNKDYFKIKETLQNLKINLLDKENYCACHCDCLPDNFVLDKDNNLYLLDWEFSENNDPIYDIACFGENDFNQALKLFDFYYPNPSINERQRLYYWRIYQNLKWFNLALYKHINGLSTEFKFDFKNISNYFIEASQEMLLELQTLI